MMVTTRKICLAGFATVVAAVLIPATGAQDNGGTGKKPTLQDLGDVLARVNGVPILTVDATPEFMSRIPPDMGFDPIKLIMPTVRETIDLELIRQQAVAGGIDKDPEFTIRIRELESKKARELTSRLANFYVRTHENANQQWVTERLSGFQYVLRHPSGTVEGIAPAVIELAVTGSFAKPPQSVLLPKVWQLVIDHEAKRQGIAPEALAADAKVAHGLVAAAKIEANGQTLVLGDVPGLEKILDTLNEEQDRNNPAFRAIANMVLAAEGRKEGVDKAPRFANSRDQLFKAAKKKRARILADVYYTRNGMGPDDFNPEKAPARNVPSAEAPAEPDLEAENGMDKKTANITLEEAREDHMKALRAAAEIEYLIDVPE